MTYTAPVSDFVITGGEYDGWRLRMRDNAVEAKAPDASRWSPSPLRGLARAYASGQGPWPWLLEHGVWRPSPSGRSQTNAERSASGKRRVVVWLTAEEVEALERRRKGRSVRDTIGALLLAK